MIAAIVAAEVAFWLFLLGGLTLRYVVRARRASTVALVAVPLVDVALVAFVAVDVLGGAEPTRAHGLAALYLGVTVAFGHHIVTSMDRRFAHRFAGGPAPVKPPKGSREEVAALWREWLRVVLAAAIACAVLALMLLAEGADLPGSIEAAAEHPYWSTMLLTGLITGIWFLAGPAFAGRGRSAQRVS